MNKIDNIVAYLCSMYPYSDELSKTRMTKLVYLADWFSSLADGKQLTNIQWIFNHYGPYVDDVIESISKNQYFEIEHSSNLYGSMKRKISYNGSKNDIDLSDREKQILDLVIEKTSPMYFNDFIDYIYSTYPIKSCDRYSILDLVELSKEYKESN